MEIIDEEIERLRLEKINVNETTIMELKERREKGLCCSDVYDREGKSRLIAKGKRLGDEFLGPRSHKYNNKINRPSVIS